MTTRYVDADHLPEAVFRMIPANGARVARVHVATGDVPTFVYCRHGITEPPDLAPPALVEWFEGEDPCRVVAVRDSYHPARLAEERLLGSKLGGGVAAFLIGNPPEACGCDPDLAIDADAPWPARVPVVFLEHETDCARAGEPATGWGTYTGGRA
jgi:hypothetical protein